MIIPAVYDGKNCYLNTDYIVDIFCTNGEFIAYTLDTQRNGYVIDIDDLKGCLIIRG